MRKELNHFKIAAVNLASATNTPYSEVEYIQHQLFDAYTQGIKDATPVEEKKEEDFKCICGDSRKPGIVHSKKTPCYLFNPPLPKQKIGRLELGYSGYSEQHFDEIEKKMNQIIDFINSSL